MKTNTHGLTMHGLRKAAGESQAYCKGYYSPRYLELFFDCSSGEVWTIWQYSTGHNAWTRYHNENIVHCGNIYSPTTMQELADLIYERTQEHHRAVGA